MQVEAAMNDLRDGLLSIPDYQRDADQWDEEMMSLFIESIINNLTVPAFFFEPKVGSDGIERNEVVDGQQRLTTLSQFWENRLRLVKAEDAPYLTPNSIHYAGKLCKDLPPAYIHAFKRYRLAIIKLRNLGDMRLEVFRRINQGGTPLSPQDIRLAYYAESRTVALIRLVGVHDKTTAASQRMLKHHAKQGGVTDDLWAGKEADCWSDWWGGGKAITNGQTASEMFLWAVVAACLDGMTDLLSNAAALRTLGVQYNGTIDEALDAACAQLRYQDRNEGTPANLLKYDTIRSSFFPFFRLWFRHIAGEKGVNLPVTKYRMVATVIGCAYALKIEPAALNLEMWTKTIEMIRRPREHDLPESKGRWNGKRGYESQLAAVRTKMSEIVGVK